MTDFDKREANETPRMGNNNLPELKDIVPVGFPLEEPLTKRRRRKLPSLSQEAAVAPVVPFPSSSAAKSLLPSLDFDLELESPEEYGIIPADPVGPSTYPCTKRALSPAEHVEVPTVSSAPDLHVQVIVKAKDEPEAAASSSSSWSRPLHPSLIKYEIEDVLDDASDQSDNDDNDDQGFKMEERADIDFAEIPEPEDDDLEQQVPIASPPAVGGEMFPRDLFHFEWTNLPNPPIPPSERRENFIGTPPPGPTRLLASPYEAFTAVWDRSIMEQIVVETNRYAQQMLSNLRANGVLSRYARLRLWKDTNVDELYVYFAIILSTAMCLKTDIKEYFFSMNSLTDTPLFAQYMTYNRYLLLNKCLHFTDNTSVAPNLPRKESKIIKVKPVVDYLNRKFKELYNLHQNIVIDESSTQWKGWLDIKQYIANKAASQGIKTFELRESNTGYLWRFEVCTGKHEVDPDVEVTPISGIIPSLVLRLVHDLHYRGHTLWMDNNYNSPALARHLKSLGIDCVGTLRTNRKFVPKELSALKEADMWEGDINAFTSGDVDVMVFCHNNIVAMISTYHGSIVSSREGSNDAKPIAISDYNLRMGGLDKKDQMLAMYLIERKRTKVWYKKLFRRLLNASVTNSLILHRQSQSPDRVTEHRKFRHTLIKQLLEHHAINESSNIFEPIRTLTFSRQRSRAIFAAGAIDHFPTLLEHDDSYKRTKRRTCTVCKKRTISYCQGCNVTLCPFTCHKQYHSS